MTDSTPRTEADWKRKAELQDAIIEAVRSADGVGGIKAFQAYDDFIEAQARTEALDEFRDHQHQSSSGTHLFDESCQWCAILETLREPLDVDRLARAIEDHLRETETGPAHWGVPECAQDIAAEYARLTREETT